MGGNDRLTGGGISTPYFLLVEKEAERGHARTMEPGTALWKLIEPDFATPTTFDGRGRAW